MNVYRNPDQLGDTLLLMSDNWIIRTDYLFHLLLYIDRHSRKWHAHCFPPCILLRSANPDSSDWNRFLLLQIRHTDHLKQHKNLYSVPEESSQTFAGTVPLQLQYESPLLAAFERLFLSFLV